GVVAEERLVELAPEAVDEELLEVLRLAEGGERAPEVRGPDAGGAAETELAEGRGREPDRVVEELPGEEDARRALAQHERGRLRRDGRAAVEGHPGRLALVGEGLRAARLRRDHGEPPAEHAGRPREEPAPADGHPVARVRDGLRGAPEGARRLGH